MSILTLEDSGDGVSQVRDERPTVWVINYDAHSTNPSPYSVHRTLAGAKAAWLELARRQFEEHGCISWEDDSEYATEDPVLDEAAALAHLEDSAKIGNDYCHIYERVLED
jgi:hypothetical protein